MLTRLSIRNFIIIEQSDITFPAGFTAITGETGAGKSLLLEALQLISGRRASQDSVGIYQDHCQINACFSLSQAFATDESFANQPLHFCLTRQINNKGKNKIFFDNKAISLQRLQAFTQPLFAISGQNLSLQLLRPDAQRQLLDRYGQYQELLLAVAHAFDAWQNASTALKALAAAQSYRQERLAWLERELAALEELNPLAGEWEALEQEQQQLGQIDAYQALLEEILEPLYEKPENALKVLHKALLSASRLTEKTASLANAFSLLQQSQVHLEEAVHEWRDYQQKLKHDPLRLAEIDERLARLARQAKRLRCAPEGLPQQLADWQQEAKHLKHLDADIAQQAEQVALAEAHYQKQAVCLQTERLKTADIFSQAVNAHLEALHLKASFQVDCRQQSPSRQGNDKITFLLQSNRGQPLRPLSKIASGGELSRIQLAIQVVSAARLALPTLIFDEIDSGLGGATAEAIGFELQRLSAHSQVIAITHQAQVAAYAKVHLAICKEETAGTTKSLVLALNAERRKAELARMLGGLIITPQTLGLAEELLGRGQAALP